MIVNMEMYTMVSYGLPYPMYVLFDTRHTPNNATHDLVVVVRVLGVPFGLDAGRGTAPALASPAGVVCIYR